MKLLHIDSSPLGTASVTRSLTAEVVAAYRAANPGLEVLRRDVVANELSHLSGELIAATKLGKTEGLSADGQAELVQAEALVNELLAADVLVIGAPMYNFSVPSQLKAWIDRVAWAGRTFRYTEKGPEGLAKGKRAIVVSARGGAYAGQGHEVAMDHQEAYLRAFLGFIGITDVQFLRAEGMGMPTRDEAIAAAKREAGKLVPVAA